LFSQFFSPAHLPWTLIVVGTFAIAMWRGGREERFAGNAVLIAWLLTKLVSRYQGHQTEWGVLLVDAGLMALFVWLALTSRRHWPIFAAGFHLLAVVTHVARMVDPTVGGWAYLTANIMWANLVLLSIVYASWTAPGRSQASTPAPAGATRR
jgi:hypothetical protein